MSNSNSLSGTRRQILKLASGVCAGLSAPWVSVSRANDTADFDVIVVGAGMAGLYAAKQLILNGHRVKVLEASNRHGGRIKTATLGDTRIEMGAEEHYLAKNNPIYDAITGLLGEDAYVKTYDADSMLSIDNGKTCWEETGDCYKDKDISKYWEYWDVFGNTSQQTDFSKTMADDVLERYGVDVNHRAYHLYDNAIAGSVYGTSLDRIGVASLAVQDQKWTLSDSIRVLAPHDLGYADVLDQLWWSDIIDHVQLNSPVKEIDSTGKFVKVTDVHGQRYTASKVIVTVSIGVLQSESIKFLPGLPRATIDAYNNIGMGRGMKVCLRFKEQIWDSKLTYFVSEGFCSSGWIPSSYKQDTPDNMVMCYPMGHSAQALTDLANKAGAGVGADNVIIEALLDDLTQMLGDKVKQSYLDGIVQNWSADPYIRGSYSYPMLET